jgi:hypothetical protein
MEDQQMVKRTRAEEIADPGERLAAVRDRWATAKERRAEVARTSVPADVAIAKAHGIVDAHAAAFQERMAPIWASALRPDFDPLRIYAEHFLGVDLGGNVAIQGRNLAQLFAVATPDTFKSLMAAAITSAATNHDGLAPAERVAALAELDAEIAALELEEERLVRALEDADRPILRRIDADPALIVAASLETHPRATAR